MKKNIIITILILFNMIISADYELVDTISSFNNTTEWSVFPENSSDVIDILGYDTGYSGRCIKVKYSLDNSQEWVVIKKSYSALSIGLADAVKIRYKGDGSGNTLEIGIADDEDNWYIKQMKGALSVNNWVDTYVTLTDLNWDKDTKTTINKFKIAVIPESTGSGEVLIDNVELYKSEYVSEDTVILTNLNVDTDVFDSGSFDLYPPNNILTDFFAHTSEYYHSDSMSYKMVYNLSSGEAAHFILIIDTPSELGIDNSYYFEFYIKGAAGGEKIEFKFYDPDSGKSKQVRVIDYIDITTSFTKVSVPVSVFTKEVDIDSIKKIEFIANENSGSGTVYIDDIYFHRYETETGTITTINNFQESVNNLEYNTFASDNGEIELAENDNESVKINYSFTETDGQWVVMERTFNLNLRAGGGLGFYLKGNDKENNIEVKLSDYDGSLFMAKLSGITKTEGEWKFIKVPFSLFAYQANNNDENNTLDLKSIKKIEIVITKGVNCDDEIYIDELQLLRFFDMSTYISNEKIISQVQVSNNPFDPATDKLKIYYTLSRPASVKLSVYNVRGYKLCNVGDINNEIEYPAGRYLIEWDGKNNNGVLQRNGLYIYRIMVTDSNGIEEDYKNVVLLLQ